jgi:hypothetical protein
VNPIICDYLTQIFHKHYSMAPAPAAEAALKFIELLELYDLKLIIGDWVVPEIRTLTPFELMTQTAMDTMEREPWLAKEIQ